MAKLANICAFFLLFITILHSTDATYNVVSYGARGDGKTDSTQAFLKAWWSACSSVKPATLYVPRGTYLIKNSAFKGPCRSKIVFRIDGNLVAPHNYWITGNHDYWILFRKVYRLSLIGRGTVDARGGRFWSCRRHGKSCPGGMKSLSFSWCTNIFVSGITSLNSQTIHMALDHCKNVYISKVWIRAPSGSPNTDGIHMKSSTGVTISSSVIMTGDDCISMSQGSKKIWIERIYCGPGHGISIGSLGDYSNEEGVQDVTVTNSVFTKTQNGVRIKTWARASNGYARNIMFRNIRMKGVSNPIIIDQTYCPYNRGCPRQSSGVKISDVTFKNIKGTSATQVAINLNCSPSKPCTGIRLQDINLGVPNKRTLSYCKHAHGKSSHVSQPRSCV